MISDCPASKKAGDSIIIDHAQAEMRTFFDELKNGTSGYKTITSLSSQVTQEYQGRCVLELLQNAHDALRNACANDRRRITFKLTTSPEPVLFVGNSGTPFRKEDFKGLCQLGQSPKNPNEYIGNKGLGFKSVMEVSLCPEIYSVAPSGNGASFAFRFDPSICETIAASACELVKNGLSLRSPFDPRCPLVCWSPANLNQYRKRLIEERIDVSKEAAKSLSPYQIPLTITNVPHDIEGMLDKEHVTVIRLPLDGGSTGTREHAVRSVTEQLRKIEANSLIFLQHLEELIIDIDGKQRILERVIETEEDLLGCPHTRYRRLLIGSSGPESGHNSTRGIHAWTRVIGGDNNPEQAEQIRAVAGHLPTQGPDISRAELGVAVEEAPTPEQGAFVIFLPTETKTGTGSHINAPFYGSLDRRHINFSDDYNEFILEKVLDLCLDAVAELISGEKEYWRAWAAIDLLSSTANVGGQDWQVMDCLHKRASCRNNKLEDQALILCDGGWRKLGKARLMPDILGDSAVSEEYWRGHAEFDVVSSAFDGRQDAVKKLIKQVKGSPDPICSEWIRTIERMAGGIQSRNIGITWNDFLSSVDYVLENVSGLGPDKLANAKFLPDQDERLISATDPAKLFFMPVRGVDDTAGFAESVPECLKQSIAFLHSNIQIHEGRKNTKVQQFLAGRFVQEFRRDELLKIVRNALPSLPASHGSNDAKMCSELLIWAMELLDGQGEDPQYRRSDTIKELPVACNAGWYCMNEAVFGPGWPSRHGDEIMSLADELPETAAAQLRKTILLPPYDSRWGGAIKDLNNLNEWLFLGGVIDGLRLQEADEIRYYVQGSSCELPTERPNETPEDAWQEWRMAVRNKAKSPYKSSFEYSLTDVYLLPEIHHLNGLSSRGRNALSKLVLTSLVQWPEDWREASVRKCSGEPRSYRIRSPLCHWLSTLPWLHDGMETQLPLSRRWLVPSNFLKDQESRYRHLVPLSLDLVQVLEEQQNLMAALVELGLNRYPVDGKLVGPELLEALADAWSAGKVHQGRFDVFLGQVRHAWQHLDPEKGLPEVFLVKTRQRDFSTRELSELADVYLPDDRDRSRSLSEHKMLVLEMSPKDAKRHSRAFSETSIRLASSLAERFVIDGDQWSGETEGIASLDHDPTYSWLPAPLLAIAAHGGQAPRGPTTQNWNDAAERLRRARLLKCEDIVVQLVDDKTVVERQHDARWLPKNVLAVRHSVGTSYKKLATAAQMMLNRQDLLKDLQLVLGALDGQDNPTHGQIESALDDIQIEAAEFADIHDLWAGTTELLADRIKPVLRLLQVPITGFDAASSNIDSLIEWLSSNIKNWSAEELLKAARTSLDDHEMGKAAWRSLGDVASLPAWNKALATLGEPYARVENENVNEQTEVHLEAAMPLLQGFARHVAVVEGRPQMFHEIETVRRSFKVGGNWRNLWWEVPFGAVMDVLRGNYAQIRGIESHLDALERAENAEELRSAFQEHGIAIELSPYEIARRNKDRLKKTFSSIHDLHRTWAEINHPDSTPPEPPEQPRDLDPEAYLHPWSEAELVERAMQTIGDKDFTAACDGGLRINDIRDRLQLDSKDVKARRRERQAREREESRESRIFDVAGIPIDPDAPDYAELWDSLRGLEAPVGPRASQDQFTPLEEFPSASQFAKGTGGGQRAANPSPSPVLHESAGVARIVGIVGEMHAYRYLQKEFGQHVVTPDAWVSLIRLKALPLVAGEPDRTDDNLGFDFCFGIDDVRWHVEVKSTMGDDQQFELGSSQINEATRLAAREPNNRWRILRIRDARSCQPKFEWLPNPWHDGSTQYYRIMKGGIRVSYFSK